MKKSKLYHETNRLIDKVQSLVDSINGNELEKAKAKYEIAELIINGMYDAHRYGNKTKKR